ncbi:CDP-glycerol glycerophosphotransferase family protein [Octadecabacter sp. 1_MG-2023]|uniref:CDP-glycerol glycerophosphotransferase family protein n=1 Tax=unclassified Octadecabacter TaxID=196158 RepID=UPI001C09B69D|nr:MULTISPECIES: CDP-glycerol glycerophosphotransferase family protein [unclassified Octadecabacter]MBU2994680.1 CDP-glycerol glycerophosphotransferase family protein [Octadecabacter sp. B2R22]MDO6734026.1 CDP-glycerol glycerophosphotransferase family protein [Octadecabacter sp. 1_MG-2023]
MLKKAKDADAFGVDGSERISSAPVFMRRKMEQYDIIVSHAKPPGKTPLRHAKFVMVQYGYAKEPYNFGDWRKQAQAILAYGDYAVDRFKAHAPSFAIGNPRLDDWNSDGFVDAARVEVGPLPTDKPVLLYAPTWGDLSSLPQWSEQVAELSQSFTVLLKAHHNSVRDGQLQRLSVSHGVIDVSHIDLMRVLAVSDVVMSDYSGAIFDGIMCDRPVVLLDVTGIDAKFGNKLDGSSLEMARRDELGTRVCTPDELRPAIAKALRDGSSITPELKASLFSSNSGSVGQAYLDALEKIAAL